MGANIMRLPSSSSVKSIAYISSLNNCERVTSSTSVKVVSQTGSYNGVAFSSATGWNNSQYEATSMGQVQITLEFPEKIQPTHLVYSTPSDTGRRLSSVIVQYSDNGSSFSDYCVEKSVSSNSAQNTLYQVNLEPTNNSAHKFFKILCTPISSRFQTSFIDLLRIE